MNNSNIGSNTVDGNNTYKEVFEGHHVVIGCAPRSNEPFRWCVFTNPLNTTFSDSKCAYTIKAVQERDDGVYRFVSM